jgi:hypothetical protein
MLLEVVSYDSSCDGLSTLQSWDLMTLESEPFQAMQSAPRFGSAVVEASISFDVMPTRLAECCVEHPTSPGSLAPPEVVVPPLIVVQAIEPMSWAIVGAPGMDAEPNPTTTSVL